MNFFKKLFVTDAPVTDQERDAELLKEARAYAERKAKERDEERWEQRRWELVRYLVGQDRRSVVLGKLNASPQAIARKARQLADATITELRTYKFDKDNGRETDNQPL